METPTISCVPSALYFPGSMKDSAKVQKTTECETRGIGFKWFSSVFEYRRSTLLRRFFNSLHTGVLISKVEGFLWVPPVENESLVRLVPDCTRLRICSRFGHLCQQVSVASEDSTWESPRCPPCPCRGSKRSCTIFEAKVIGKSNTV